MDPTIRPLTDADVDATREVQTRSFQALDAAEGKPPMEVTPDVVERQRGRVRHFLTHDPGGAWVAEVDGAVVGAALALRRDSMWGLSLLVVDPGIQSRGLGRRLLDASLTYADGVQSAVILSSQDARAIRAYAAAGFDLHPQVHATGKVDRALLPAPSVRVRAGSVADASLADDVDRAVRGAVRGPDHRALGEHNRMFVVDDGDGRGYAYLRPEGRVTAVAATDDETATALLWQCLAQAGDVEVTVDHVNAGQQWAVRVAVAARLKLAPAGCVFWRGRTPPPSYLPDGAYL